MMKLMLSKVSLTVALCLLSLTAVAQSAIHGKVVDQAGEPVIGASILIDGALLQVR